MYLKTNIFSLKFIPFCHLFWGCCTMTKVTKRNLLTFLDIKYGIRYDSVKT